MLLFWVVVVSTWSEAASLPSVVTGTVTSTDYTSPHDDVTTTDHTFPHRAPLPPAADSHIQLGNVDVSPLLHLVGQGAPQQNLVEETVPQPSLSGQDPPQPRLAGHFAPQPLQYPPEGQSYLATIPVFHPPAITPPPPTVQGQELPGLTPPPPRGQEPSVSPYWADPDGRPPPPSYSPNTDPTHLAPPPTTCTRAVGACNASYPYRTMSGRCNNLLYPELGSSEQPMPRILPPVYDFAFMRTKSVAGARLLPNPREVSLLVHTASLEQPLQETSLLMQLGQFIDHDLVLTRKVLEAEVNMDCKDCGSWRNPVCAPIPLPLQDPYISPKLDYGDRRRCLPFIRSVADWRPDGAGQFTLQQRNFNTAFLDLSQVYGSDECRNEKLRLYSVGQLKESYRGFPQLLPADPFIDCRMPQRRCFFTGDEKANEQLGLLVVHVLYLREHNRLARELHGINPHWDDERLFQEARRINIAQYQNMIYKEFLPVLIGRQKVQEYKLRPGTRGYYRGYKEHVNPGVLNEFATAAFRVGHTMVVDDLTLLDRHYRPAATIPLVHTFQNPSAVLGAGNYDGLMRGLVGTEMNNVDLRLVDAIINRLFEQAGVPHSGQDLLALNIARGRDHAIASYSAYLAVCKERSVAVWEDLEPYITHDAVDVFRKAYLHVQDVDLFVGAVAEEPVAGGLVGPTLACIIAYQFLNLKRGDRFWYENANAGFSLEQLQSIRRSSLARVVCENMDDVAPKIPKKVFHIHGAKNPVVPCEDIQGTALDLWAEDPHQGPRYCVFQGHHYPPGRVVPVSPCSYCVCQPHGQLKCQPDMGGCRTSVVDDHCRKVCRHDPDDSDGQLYHDDLTRPKTRR